MSISCLRWLFRLGDGPPCSIIGYVPEHGIARHLHRKRVDASVGFTPIIVLVFIGGSITVLEFIGGSIGSTCSIGWTGWKVNLCAPVNTLEFDLLPQLVNWKLDSLEGLKDQIISGKFAKCLVCFVLGGEINLASGRGGSGRLKSLLTGVGSAVIVVKQILPVAEGHEGRLDRIFVRRSAGERAR